jgi:hypothetical protein
VHADNRDIRFAIACRVENDKNKRKQRARSSVRPFHSYVLLAGTVAKH